MIPAHSRWTGLVGIAIGNVLPLQLVWTGRLDLPDLLLVYLLELLLAGALLLLGVGARDGEAQGHVVQAKHYLAGTVLAVLIGAPLTSSTLRAVTWDTTTAWVVVAAFVSSLIGTVATLRRRSTRWRSGLLGTFVWRLALMGVAVMAASAGSSYGRLVAASWEPHSFGNGWALPAGEVLTGLALELDLSPVVIAAGILCTYRLLSELLYEVYDILRDETATARPGE